METAQNSQPLSLNRNGSPPQQFPSPYGTEVQEPEEDELELGQLLGVVRRRAVLIAGVTTAVTAAALIGTVNQTPKYQGKFQLLVEPVSSSNKLSAAAAMAQNLGFGGGLGNSGLDYDSQLEVLQSHKVMDPIIQQLHARYPDIDYKSLLGKKTLSIGRLKKTKLIEISYLDPDPEKVQFVLEQVAQGYLNYSRDDRKTASRQGIQFIDTQLPKLRERVDKLQADLQLFRQQKQLIDPQVQGQQLAQQLAQLQNQSMENQTALTQYRGIYQTLKQQLGLDPNSAIAASALSESPRYQNLLNQLQDIESAISSELTRFRENHPNIQVLRERQRNLLPLLQEEAENVLGKDLASVVGNPQALTFQSSIRRNLAGQLVSTVQTIQILEVRDKAITQAINALNQDILNFPVTVREFTDRQRELGVATNTLNQFLAQREGLQVDAAKEDVPWELTEDVKAPKIPRNENGKLIPASPSLMRNVALGTILGLMLGLGAAMLAERLNNVFHSADELKDATRWPLLGVIPSSERDAQPAPPALIADSIPTDQFHYASTSPFVEAFRSLNANLRLLGAGSPIRSLAVSSPAPADGKSTVAAHLALAAAAMGQRVLLVDADLRWPYLHDLLGLPNKRGLSDVVATALAPEEAIQKAPHEENLFVLTAGSVPPDPLRLLSSKKMHNLMAQWQADYDLIIYDTPPLLGLADGSLLAGHTNGILLVVSMGETDRSEVKQALEGLQMAGTPVLGVVANRAKEFATGSYYNRRRYYAPPAEEQSPDPDAVSV
ncbi:GumC family protein [Kamptonema formosum]|uniref:GumC family protein n=1 Tax=Kamptonema formosum TaxID=331992 RepID=UPI000349065E|nr:polysaccharide biosynthesis tyrosine autokinase [Oscillatoria sp. PCC 10802]